MSEASLTFRLFIFSLYVIMALMTLWVGKYAPLTFKHAEKVCAALYLMLGMLNVLFM